MVIRNIGILLLLTLSSQTVAQDANDPSFLWENAAEMREEWGGQFGIKSIISVEDAKLAAVDRRKP